MDGIIAHQDTIGKSGDSLCRWVEAIVSCRRWGGAQLHLLYAARLTPPPPTCWLYLCVSDVSEWTLLDSVCRRRQTDWFNRRDEVCTASHGSTHTDRQTDRQAYRQINASIHVSIIPQTSYHIKTNTLTHTKTEKKI